jgi:hypothetical protein
MQKEILDLIEKIYFRSESIKQGEDKHESEIKDADAFNIVEYELQVTWNCELFFYK